MVDCPRCHTQYEEAPAFCGVCGKPMPGKDPIVAPEADPLVGVVVDGRYRIIDLIGRGGMGAVYRAEHVKMGKVMAIKILQGNLSKDTDVCRRFKREAETVSLLSHINTVSVFDFGTYEGMMYLVMEYIDGQDLGELVRSEGTIPFARVARIMIQVCSALNEAHAKGVVHRDLKPGNILVGFRDEQADFVKVVDFGLARLRDMNKRTRITEQGSLVGTPYYMAPEHIKGENVDARSDIYSLGAVMHRLLTGEVPFPADTPMGVITKHLTEQLRPMAKRFPELELPAVADDIVLKSMAKKPEERFQSAEELRTALADAVERLSPGSGFRRFSSTSEAPPPAGGEPGKPGEGEGLVATNRGGRSKAAAGATVTRGSLSKSSVIIGSREVSIGTKSDFINFEQGMKNLRRKRIAIVLAPVAVLLASALYFALAQGRSASDPAAETEPNDTPPEADPLTPGVELSGAIAGARADGDIDWYRLPGPGAVPWRAEVEIAGVPGLDLGMQLIEPMGQKPIAVANSGGQGRAERIGATAVNRPYVYLMVQEVRAPGAKPGDFRSTPYKLVYRIGDNAVSEKEPNNDVASATRVERAVEAKGSLGPGDPIDWYCHAAGAEIQTIQVSGMAGVDLALTLQLGASAAPIPINNYGVGLGEAVALPKGPGPICAGVRIEAPAGGAPPAGAKGSYQIVFQ